MLFLLLFFGGMSFILHYVFTTITAVYNTLLLYDFFKTRWLWCWCTFCKFLFHVYKLFWCLNDWQDRQLTNSSHRQAPTQHRSPISWSRAIDTSLNSTLQIYWQLLKNIYCPTSSPSGHLACNLPTRLLDHLSKPQAFLLSLFFLFVIIPSFYFLERRSVYVLYVHVWMEREGERNTGWDIRVQWALEINSFHAFLFLFKREFTAD